MSNSVQPAPPVHPDATWLYEPRRASYPESLMQSELMRACLTAATELGTRRKRSSAERALLAENVGHLLRAVAIREAYGGAPGSMHWHIRHCRDNLVDAADAALKAEYRRSRYRVLQWALAEAFGSEGTPCLQDPRLQMTLEGQKASVAIWSHKSEAGHIAAISLLDQIRRLRLTADVSPTDERDQAS